MIKNKKKKDNEKENQKVSVTQDDEQQKALLAKIQKWVNEEPEGAWQKCIDKTTVGTIYTTKFFCLDM